MAKEVPKWKKATVILELVDTEGATHILRYPMSGIDYRHEKGEIKTRTGTMPNGQERFTLKGWLGCKSYEDFIAREEI